MANELSVALSLRYSKNGISLNRYVTDSVTVAGNSYLSGVQIIGFSAHEALSLGDVATAGYVLLRNTDGTNYVQVGIDSSGTFVPSIKLLAGEAAMFRAGAVLYAKADTAAVNLESWVIEV